jgi:catechol 2,3-dioxygenase-like lactoylglutathione lyase family enzyme
MGARLVPELYVESIERSLRFYTTVIGFTVRYERPESRFAYLDLDGAELMIEQIEPGPRCWLTGTLEHPFGRGLNLQIEVSDVDALHDRVVDAGLPLFQPMEESWYRRGGEEVGNRQFLVQDPDGYLLRFFSSLGARALPSAPPRPLARHFG